jgi:hypothetical protein
MMPLAELWAWVERERAMMPKTITELWAWVAIEPDGGEGVMGSEMMIDGRTMFVPLVGADRERIESYRGHAEKIAGLSGCKVKLMRYSEAQEIERL